MTSFRLFAFSLLLAGCGNPVTPVTVNDQRLVADLRRCDINPADAVQVDERVNGEASNYLVFSSVAPYPEAKMRCLAHILLRADYGVRRSGERFEEAYGRAWKAEWAIYKQELATSWLREHHGRARPPQFVQGKQSLEDFARELERFCIAKPGTLLVDMQSLRVPWPEVEPQFECLLIAAYATNLEREGFRVYMPGE
ncbi:MAG: hypothetical protein EON59_08690 [Alphaproteobacteria bacterium]|nr:MAG: hypothetical protein EON59_08690 [Alphaproteobacteria bacterium]